MYSSFQTWAETFNNQDALSTTEATKADLSALEQALIQSASGQGANGQSLPGLKRARKGKAELTAPDITAVETTQTDYPEQALDRFANILANVVIHRLTQDQFVEKMVQARSLQQENDELKKDNEQLALQIKSLLKQQKNAESDIRSLETCLGQYKRIVGNLFLKLD
ncbi:MAG: hypothetical protein K2X01_08970 [Cyanobacteria bacterium]|nr:hypothetical protein [Cyanobacteriota bacterium]